jgi:hypothetical protein
VCERESAGTRFKVKEKSERKKEEVSNKKAKG